MKIAVEGCCHGELDKIYETIEYLEKKNDTKVDLLLICGDFQAVRNTSDLQCMAVPPKYQKLNTFYKYYSGEKVAPVLTIFIGGNHEASNYLQELPYGGWVAKNIYYMGYANVVQCAGLRIGGLSGIYNGKDYNKGHFERAPYNDATKRSVYHVRNLEVFRLKQISRPLDIFISHDWPRGIYNYGNVQELLRKKKFFTEEIECNKLGSLPNEELLHVLKPNYWFSAHLHVKFAAFVQHVTEDSGEKTTKFLALDKCLPRRKFLQVLDIPHDNNQPIKLQLDPEWLSIIKQTNHLLNLKPTFSYMPGPGSNDRFNFKVKEEELETIKEDFGGDLTIPDNFSETTPAHDYNNPTKRHKVSVTINPQTTLLCTMLDLTDPNAVFLGKDSKLDMSSINNPEENDLDDDLEDDDGDDDGVDADDSESDINSSINTTYESFSILNSSELSVDNTADLSVCSLNASEISEDDEDELKAILELQKAERLSDENSEQATDEENRSSANQKTSTPSVHKKMTVCQQIEASLELCQRESLKGSDEILSPISHCVAKDIQGTDNSSADSSADDSLVSGKSEKRASDSDESPIKKRVKMKRRNIVLYSDQESDEQQHQ